MYAHISNIPHVIADNLTLDEVTDDPPVNAAADNMTEESTYNDRGPSKQKSTGKALSNADIKTQC